MQNKAAINLYGSAEMHGHTLEAHAVRRNLDLLQQTLQIHVGRAIDDDAQCAVFIVFADEGQRAGKVRINHGGHGDEKVLGEVDAVHKSKYCKAGVRQRQLKFNSAAPSQPSTFAEFP